MSLTIRHAVLYTPTSAGGGVNLTRDVSDSAAATDAASRALNVARSVTDTAVATTATITLNLTTIRRATV